MTYDEHQQSAVLRVCTCCGVQWWMTKPEPTCIRCRRTEKRPDVASAGPGVEREPEQLNGQGKAVQQ